MPVKKNLGWSALCIGIMSIAGCGKSAEKIASNTPTMANQTDAAHSHDGWWCDEHGVPEEVCTQCNASLVADFKAKGDWCKEHDRPDSQCFICHPEREAEFAAQYEAKYGTKPPKPEKDAPETKS